MVVPTEARISLDHMAHGMSEADYIDTIWQMRNAQYQVTKAKGRWPIKRLADLPTTVIKFKRSKK